MTKPTIPNTNVPITDKKGMATYAWQRFLLSLVQASGSISAIIAGKTITADAIEIGSGLYGTQSGQNLLLTSGLTIDDDGDAFTNISTIILQGDFDVTGAGTSITLTAPAGAVEVAQSGATRVEAATVLNFTGNAIVTGIDDQANILIGSMIVENDGTTIGYANTLNFGTLLSVSGGPGYSEIDFAGIGAQQGTTSLGQFIDINIGKGIVGSIGTGSLAGTLRLSGTGTQFIDGASTVSGVFGAIAGSGVSFVGTAGPFITIVATEGSSGSSGVMFDGTLYGTVAAGAGVTIVPSGEELIFSATSAGGGAIYAPMVNGDLPGPGIMADGLGQCIMTEI